MNEPTPIFCDLIAEAPPRSFRLLKDAAISLSLANLLFIQSWFGLLFSTDHGYFNKVPVTMPALLALSANLFLLAAVFWLASVVVRRTRNKGIKVAARLALCALLLIPLNFARLELLGVRGTTLLALAKSPLLLAAGFVAAAAVVRWSRVAARVAVVLVVVFLPLTFFTFGHLVVAFFKQEARVTWRRPVVPAVAAQDLALPRVLWIIFDELDQRIAFAERPAKVQLPELDRLRQQSLYAPNAYPPAGNTRLSLPALTTGRSVIKAQPVGASELLLTFADTKQSEGWSTQPTLFSRARQMGVHTGLVGWYHPYARLFGSALEYCEWHPYPPFEQARDWTFSGSLANQICAMVSPFQQRRLQVKMYEHALRDARDLATNAGFGVLLLHLPVPHLPGIYSPERQQLTLLNFSRTQGYLDNLALTDRTLGELRRAMERTDLWDKTWVLVSADHWWRESSRYDGKTDHRVPFIVKPAGTGPPMVYSPAFNTILTSDLVMAILERKIASGEQLIPWLDLHRSDPPASYPEAHER